MQRWFFIFVLVSGLLFAKTPYKIGICGNSRLVEEIELNLELDSRFLIQSCHDKKLDAQIRVSSEKIEVYSDGKYLFHQKKSVSAKKLTQELIQNLQVKPKIVQPVREPVKPIAEEQTSPRPTSRGPAWIPGQARDDGAMPVGSAETEIPLADEEDDIVQESSKNWQFEAAASMDQWNSGVSTRVYPGTQIKGRVQLFEDWWLVSQWGFGSSAFRIQDQVVWSQQLVGTLNLARTFQAFQDFEIGPQGGYFYWGSWSGNEQVSQAQRHDLSLGVEVVYHVSRVRISANLNFLPVHLGLQTQTAIRCDITSNWYAVIQGYVVSLWGNEPESSFFSASLGLGLDV